ncbi:hypothetical protein [Bradyrhizobium sp. 195]|uniref:hypothetical protein n=1 Tax=Bradyrhizobium sp. 195 TaxID=2782662 RepID=UPI0020019310|nr:hypothetical protein [Bradyrhizobium sp. 195]
MDSPFPDRHEIDVRHLTAKLLAPSFIGRAIRVAVKGELRLDHRSGGAGLLAIAAGCIVMPLRRNGKSGELRDKPLAMTR